MKMVLSLQAPVLSMPQMFDSMPLLILARDPHFLKILRKGIISTSLFGENRSLKQYVEACLRRDDYIFSSLPFLSERSKSGSLTEETKKILLGKLSNRGSTTKYSKDLEDYEYFLDTFIEGVDLLDSALQAGPSDEIQNYRRNLPNAKVAPLSQKIGDNLSTLKHHDSFTKHSVIKKFDDMVSRILSEQKDMNNRTRYYNALDNSQDMDVTEKKKIRELIDVSYNQSMAPLIAKTSRMAVRKGNEYADVLIEETPEEDLSERDMSVEIERIYDEIQKDCVSSCDGEKETITPEKLNDILETVESCIKEMPGVGREGVIDYLFDRYCAIVEREYAISLEPDGLKRGLHVTEVTSENKQEKEKWLKKIENSNGDVELVVEEIKMKKVLVSEGPNLDGDNTKKVAESTI
jgi:hypothetical protein